MSKLLLFPVIAIDGHAGSGKSTVAQAVADQLGFLHVNTGILYRALTWKALTQGLNLNNQQDIEQLAHDAQLKPYSQSGNTTGVLLDGQDVTAQLRTTSINNAVSQVSAYPGVRTAITRQLQHMQPDTGIVMDGRDIGTIVFPTAPLKLFLTASLEERAKRQFSDEKLKDPLLSLSEFIHILAERDKKDSERSVAPLKLASDAVLIDTTGMPMESVVVQVLELWKNKQLTLTAQVKHV